MHCNWESLSAFWFLTDLAEVKDIVRTSTPDSFFAVNG